MSTLEMTTHWGPGPAMRGPYRCWGRSVVSIGWHSTPADSVRGHDWCVGQADVYLLPLPASIFPSHSRTVTSSVGPNQPGVLTSPCRRRFVGIAPQRQRWLKRRKDSQARTEKPKLSPQGQRSSLERPDSICHKCQMSHPCVPRISRTSGKAGPLEMEGDDVPRQPLPFRRGHSTALTKFFTRKTHAWIIPLYMPGFVFPCVKLQLYRCPAGAAMLTDWHARGQPSTCVRHKDLFLSYNRLSCPEWIFGFTARPSSVSRLQRTVEGAFRDDRLPLSKGRGCTRLVDSSASREIAAGTWTDQTGRKRREAVRRKAAERRGLEAMPGRRWAAL